MDKYKLLKDLPLLKAGAIFEKKPWKDQYINREDYMKSEMGEKNGYYIFIERDIKSETEWFEKIK